MFRDPILSPNNFTPDHLVIKREWLIANVTSVGFPARAEREMLRLILDIIWPIQAAIVAGETVCDLGIPCCIEH